MEVGWGLVSWWWGIRLHAGYSGIQEGPFLQGEEAEATGEAPGLAEEGATDTGVPPVGLFGTILWA